MTPYLQTKNVTLYHGDCREILPSLPIFDLLLTDPPYGIKESNEKNATRGNLAKPRDYGFYDWDKEPISQELLDAMIKKAKYQIIWGGNYYSVAPSSCWLIWDKQNGANDFADCELAWTNFPKAVRIIRHMWNGMLRKGNEPRLHPTQKPLAVIEWALQQCPLAPRSVLDPMCGSGTTLVAAYRAGCESTGIEREERNCEITAKRIEREIAQGQLFEPEPRPQSRQEALIL